MNGPPAADARPVRAGEQLDWARLEAYLREHLPASAGVPAGSPMEVLQFPGGHSNLTYLVRFGDVELVMRRPPLGPVAPTAHDMAREHRWLTALHPVFPLAPRPYLVCEDISVVGSVFYVMERRKGRVVRHEDVAAWADHPEDCRRVSEALVDTLAALHRIDVAAHGLAGLGKPAGFVGRQVRGWTERWQRSKTDSVPEMEALSEWLVQRLPADPQPPAIVHGDFKLDNVMLDPADCGRLVGVFDWEMCALGDPLVDLGILLAYWPPSAPGERKAEAASAAWPGHDEIVARYAAKSGRDVSAVGYYETFALFKVAVVIQQIFFRYSRGQTDDARFASFGPRVHSLAREAWQRTGEARA
jgi:aminoglycoside phosphotransferase (APT) family kinase protein